MKRWFNCFIVLLSLLGATSSDAGVKRGISATAGAARVQKSLVADYGATCDGVADDTAAWVAFRTAFQGTTPVQLNLTGFCTYNQAGGGFFALAGIGDLIIAGNGASTSSIKRRATDNNFALGGRGQTQDSAHSLRTADATAGDSCVTVKTVPAFTVSDAQNNLPTPTSFTASIPLGGTFTGTQSGTNLTASSVTGTIGVGSTLNGSGVAANSIILSQTSGTTGGAGVYVTDQAGTASGSSITATGNVMVVSAVSTGSILAGAFIANQDSNPGGFQAINTQLTGPAGGAGNYSLRTYPQSAVSSQAFVTAPASYTASVDANGLMTVNSIIEGQIYAGMFVYNLNGGPGLNTAIVLPFGTAGGTGTGTTGTYQLSRPGQNAISLTPFIGNGQIRLTVSSTAGMVTGVAGDTIFISGMTGRGALPQRLNGLRWIKVIDATHIDLFQSDFNGSYSSGGTGGGDRTSVTPAGLPVMMSGYVLQSYWANPYGYPSNQHWFEYLTVASTNSSTHQVCFTTPLVNSYKSTWPQFNTGNLFEIDAAGPATLYALPASWELTHEYRDLTIDNLPNQTTANGRNITYRNVTFAGNNCPIPSQNQTHNWINVSGSTCNVETDKLVNTWNITNTTLNLVNIQSSSMDVINVNNATVKAWYGTPKNFTANNLTITCAGCAGGTSALSIGTAAYGVSDSSSITTASVPVTMLMGIGSVGQKANSPTHPWTMASGVITIPNRYSTGGIDALGDTSAFETQVRGIVPGHYVMWQGSQVGGSFKVLGVTQDTDNIYVQTDQAGGFPLGAWTASGLSAIAHPAPLFTVSGMTGDQTATIFNGCTALPMFSCANGISTGGASGVTAQFPPILWGTFDTFTFTTNTPTFAGALTWNLSRFGNWPVLKTDLTTISYAGSSLNTKLPTTCGSCTRTQTTSGVTNPQTGDTFVLPPTDAWFGGAASSGPNFSVNTPSDSPQVTYGLRTNQHLNFLLKRDMKIPEFKNDNTPMWTEKTA